LAGNIQGAPGKGVGAGGAVVRSGDIEVVLGDSARGRGESQPRRGRVPIRGVPALVDEIPLDDEQVPPLWVKVPLPCTPTNSL